MRPLLLFIVCVLTVVGVHAQSLYLYDVNPAGFPVIRANYVAVDALGRVYPSLSATDFRVNEQAGSGFPVDVSASVTHGCRVLARDSAASILLIVDESLSMEDRVGAVARIDLVKQALATFVSGLNLNNGSAVCIIGFSGNSRIACPWTSSRAVLLDSINRLSPKGATNYESPFIGIPNCFDEFAKRPSGIAKTAIFITDDQPNPAIGNPNALVDTVVRKANEQSIVIHSISIDELNTNPTLAAIVAKTGGTSHAGTEAMMGTFFELIQYSVTTRQICYIEWRVPYGCTAYDRERTAVVTLVKDNTANDTVIYVTSAASVAIVNSSTPMVELGSPSPNSSTYGTVTFTPVNHDLLVRGFAISPSTHFSVVDWDYPRNAINPPSPTNVLTFKANVPRTLGIRLTEGQNPAFHTAMLSLIADPCTIVQALRGGGTKVVVVTPNGGEVLTTCDTVDITWSGVPDRVPVRIQWSLDGTNWNTITNQATGLSYRWLPVVKGTTYRIRITYTPGTAYTWLQQIGHTGIDTASSVAARPGGDKVYVTGWYSGSTQFSSTPINNPQGAKDGFMQEYDSDGLWGKTFLLTGENGKNEKIVGAVTDEKGNVYIAGTFESTTATLSNGTTSTTLRMPSGQAGSVRDVSNMFVARVSSAGSVDWVRYGQGTSRYAAEATATGIGISKNSKGQPQIVVTGTFISFIHAGTTKAGAQMQLGPALPPGPFYAEYDEFGNTMSVMARTAPTSYRYASKTTKDSAGCTYETDVFTGTVFKGGFWATARSTSTDVYVARTCMGPESVDESNDVFTVRKPALTLADPVFTMSPTTVGTSSTNTFVQRICNTEAEPVQILNTTLTGPHASEFTFVTPIVGRFIQPNECIDVLLEFKPTGQGNRTATMNVIGECGSLASPALLGVGVSGCNLFVINKVQMTDVVVGTTSTTSPCIIRNTTAAPITVSVRIEPAGTRFDVNPKGPIPLAPNECFSPTISFDATAATTGEYTAKLAYDLPDDCGTLTSDLVASVLDSVVEPPKDSSVSINSIDWFARRLRTVNDSVLQMVNDGKQDLYIDNIGTGNINGDITAEFSSLPARPFLLRVGERLDIPVRFDPTTRGAHTLEVVATVRGLNTPVKGLARGVGILPAIEATGDNWPITPVLTVAAKTGVVTIRNTDGTTPLHIDNVEFVRPGQSDFRWAVPSATLFPAIIQPNQELSIPVQFVPQAGGVRLELVRVIHDAKPGPGPVPPFAETTVELLGLAQSTDALAPLAFPPTLTCEEATQTMWLKNPSETVPFVVDSVGELDLNNVFEVMTATPVVIPPGDSVPITVRFAPKVRQLYAATYYLHNNSIPGMYVNVSGEGITTELRTSFPNLGITSEYWSGTAVTILVAPENPLYAGLERFAVEVNYPTENMRYVLGTAVSAANSPLMVESEDASVPGRLLLQVRVVGTFDSEQELRTTFQPLLSVDTVAEFHARPITEYPCVVPVEGTGEKLITRTCAGDGRVVSMGTNGFMLGRMYPSPAVDRLTVTYALGYTTPFNFELIDAVGNVVGNIALEEQSSAEYEVDIPVQDLASGTYVLRLTAGHYVESKVFAIVR